MNDYEIPMGKLTIANPNPDYNISFHRDGKQIGKLDFNGDEMVLVGNVDESAKVFFDYLALIAAFVTRSNASPWLIPNALSIDANAWSISSSYVPVSSSLIVVNAIRASSSASMSALFTRHSKSISAFMLCLALLGCGVIGLILSNIFLPRS